MMFDRSTSCPCEIGSPSAALDKSGSPSFLRELPPEWVVYTSRARSVAGVIVKRTMPFDQSWIGQRRIPAVFHQAERQAIILCCLIDNA